MNDSFVLEMQNIQSTFTKYVFLYLAHGVQLKIQTLNRPNHREIHGDHVIKSIYHTNECYALTNYLISADPPRGGGEGGDGGGEGDGFPGGPPNGKRPGGGIILP